MATKQMKCFRKEETESAIVVYFQGEDVVWSDNALTVSFVGDDKPFAVDFIVGRSYTLTVGPEVKG